LVADRSEAINLSFALFGSKVYLLTHKRAPNFAVIEKGLNANSPDHAVIVPESASVIQSIAAAKDGLYLRQLRKGSSALSRWVFKTRSIEEVKLPLSHAGIVSLSGSASRTGAIVALTTWTRPPEWYECRGRKDCRRLDIPARSGLEITDVEIREEQATSKDGTRIPLTIVHKRGLNHDRENPTWLMGYGSYGNVLGPRFGTSLMAWLERGGVYAVAHVRGGGEYGEAWHEAGKLTNKYHTIEDFIACAEYLVDQNYTAPTHLAAEGGSAGGIAIGGAITERPDLFAAAVIRVGALDMLRLELTDGGPANVHEFGSVRTKEGFESLLRVSPYHHVQPGIKYPAVLLSVGMQDPRVPVWQSAKMAARLQAYTTSGKPILLRVDNEAGHRGSTHSQGIEEWADIMTFLWSQVGQRQAHRLGSRLGD
jgi:prolyl oligopeptidase